MCAQYCSVCLISVGFFFFFFFKQKTAYEMRISDWSSDVCSSDLGGRKAARSRAARQLEYERKRASENNGVWDCQRSTRLYEKHRPSVLIGDHSRDRKSTRLNSSH